jgi:hypothetical protein
MLSSASVIKRAPGAFPSAFWRRSGSSVSRIIEARASTHSHDAVDDREKESDWVVVPHPQILQHIREKAWDKRAGGVAWRAGSKEKANLKRWVELQFVEHWHEHVRAEHTNQNLCDDDYPVLGAKSVNLGRHAEQRDAGDVAAKWGFKLYRLIAASLKLHTSIQPAKIAWFLPLKTNNDENKGWYHWQCKMQIYLPETIIWTIKLMLKRN